MARAGPLGGEDLPTSAATPSGLYLPPEQHAALPASVAVTAVTDLLFGYPIIFGRRVTEEAPWGKRNAPHGLRSLEGCGLVCIEDGWVSPLMFEPAFIKSRARDPATSQLGVGSFRDFGTVKKVVPGAHANVSWLTATSACPENID